MVERRKGGESGVVAVQYATRRKLLVRSSLEMLISGRVTKTYNLES